MPACDTALSARWRHTPNFQPRRNGLTPTILLMHYTGMQTAKAAEELLCSDKSGVSCHYLLDETGAITQMVPETERAWHAGQSHWAGEDDVNSCSIGIEVVNLGHELGYPAFPEVQVAALIELSRDILSRHPIKPRHVLGHSDVAPGRKKDPGEKFPWQKLFAQGIGHWVEPAPLYDDAGLGPGDQGDEVSAAQQLLGRYGYLIDHNGHYGQQTESVVTAFQRHFRPQQVDGRLDRSTMETLQKVLTQLPDETASF